MIKDKIVINVNSNFHHARGNDLLETGQSCFKEYREKWRKWPEDFFVGDFPLFIDIEATSVCNLRCPFCATTFRKNKIKKGFILLETVKKIIDEGSQNSLYGVKFNIRGEPLLHPEIHNFVKYAKEKGLIDVYFNTNAALLNEEISQRLIEAGLDRITISVEGHTKETYERYRIGSKFETLVSNIEKIQFLKQRLGVKHPKIRIQSVMLPELEPAFENYKKFWSERVDEVAFLDYKEMKLKRRGIRYPWACPQLWQRVAIWWDGTILPCNHDDDGLSALGNVRDMTIEQAWNSLKLNQVRALHVKGQAHMVSSCDGCYLRDSEVNKLLSY